MFNNNNSDILLFNLLKINTFVYKNFEIIIIDNSDDKYKPLFIDNIIFNFPIKIINKYKYNEDIINSNGDIIIIQKSNSYFIENPIKDIIDNFEYDNFFNYCSYDLVNIDENNNILNNNYKLDKLTKNNKNFNCFVISKNYFKILNGFNEEYDTSFDFILNDFYLRAINNIKLNLKNIYNKVINLFNINNYNILINYDNENVKMSAMLYSYKFNNSMYNYYNNNNNIFSCPKIFHCYINNCNNNEEYINSLNISLTYNSDFTHIVYTTDNKNLNFNNIKNFKNIVFFNNINFDFLYDKDIYNKNEYDIFIYNILYLFGGIIYDYTIIFNKNISEIVNYNFENLYYKNNNNNLLLVSRKTLFLKKLLKNIKEYKFFEISSILSKYIKKSKYIKFITNINTHVEKKYINLENKNIIFFNITNITSDYNYYMTNMKRYYNILKTKYNVEYRDIKLDYSNNFNKNNIKDYLSFNDGDIFIIDDITLTILITSHLNIITTKENIEYFVNNAKYINCFSEIFISNDLQFTGCYLNNKNFVKLFFIKAITNLILNTVNLYYLFENNINNYIYYPSYGYSEINNICYIKNNAEQNLEKDIDILFYGNIRSSSGTIIHHYRNANVNKIKLNYENTNIVFKIFNNLYEEKDNILKKTKIVIHVSPCKDFHILSWAKVVELMSKKIFFIVEENEELYIKKLDKIIIFYKKNNLDDLYEKINYYLKNEDIRNNNIELCYDYIKKNYNMDIFLINLLNNI